MSAAGIPRVLMAGVPAMTLREVRLQAQDKGDGCHWSRTCWCGAGHDGGNAGLTVTAPPWDGSRRGEQAR